MARILIADDEEPIRQLLRTTLERAGYEVDEAADGDEALDSARAHPPDLLITDLIMPNREGLETIREFVKRMPATKIIAISGGMRNGTMDFLPAARKFGADVGLRKPFPTQELLDSVSDLLDGVGDDT